MEVMLLDKIAVRLSSYMIMGWPKLLSSTSSPISVTRGEVPYFYVTA
jgi:hypothetical protein